MLNELRAVPVVADALDPDQVAEAVARARPDAIVHQPTAIGAMTCVPSIATSLTNRLRTEGTDYPPSAGQAVVVPRLVAQSNGADAKVLARLGERERNAGTKALKGVTDL